MPIVLVAASVAALADAVTARIEAEAARSIAARGRFALAVPGGSVATACLPRLVSGALDWARTDVFFGDERAVPPDHPDSNAGLVRRLLLAHVPVPAHRVHVMAGDELALQAAADRYATSMVEVLGEPPVLDLVLLGVGEDGHVCSLFPGAAALGMAGAWVAAITDAPKPPPRRLTLTLPTLTTARQRLVVAMGSHKASAIRAAIHDEKSPLPVARLARRSTHTWFMLDAGAASGLEWPRLP